MFVVGEKVKDLQDRVCHLMMVIVDIVTSKNENGSDEVIVKAAKGTMDSGRALVWTVTCQC
jgi:hypothetical protein